ncbi:EF-hand domain-containing protein [Limnofasciculus baicalensis]|uniref:EF-hand domain-containing protein n=1 Tax=Limnofasciculus baicalensis BBK-W-15 TaxID=2699891 RepID=A0AAE3GVD6_9CYAN|nr:EF-hand domain-containing protein [Limnofasciculus baicalensis]MCP2731381.1 EF-hand domain-containing protein [Limnofasciculus baicalensis BBK-W-15]
MDNFLERKISQRFRTYDENGNGFIERIDFEMSVARLAEEFGHESESPARQRLLDLSLGLWEHLLQVADTNTDGRISESEYKAAFASGLLESAETFDQGYVPFLCAIMDIADEDGDGKLSVTDEIRWTGAMMHLSEEDAREGFRRLDLDEDGFITTHELLEAIRAYYFDNSPDSPGYWLLGPLKP